MLSTAGKHPYTTLLIICLLSLAMHWHVLNQELTGVHVWRQTQTQTVINNFVDDGLNIFEPKRNDHAHTDRIDRMEFPIMQWLFAVAQKYISDHIAVSRILSLLLGFLSITGMFKLGKLIFKHQAMAVAGAWAFCFSPVFYYYTINPLPDNFALCTGIWSLVHFFKYTTNNKQLSIFISAALLSLAAAAKLPYILFGSVLFGPLYFETIKGGHYSKGLKLVTIFTIALLPVFAWYITVMPHWNGNGVLNGILDTSNYTLESILHIITGTIISTLPELLLNYGSVLFFVYGLVLVVKMKWGNSSTMLSLIALLASICAYFIFEMNMIVLVHDYYLMPFLPILFLIVAFGAVKLYNHKQLPVRVLVILLFISLPVFAALRINDRWSAENAGFNNIYYHHQKELQQLVPENAYCVVGNDESSFILLYYLDRKGWAFRGDQLYDYDLRFYIFEGAGFLFSDSPATDVSGIQQLIESKIFEEGNLKVYKLKNKSEI